MDHHAARLLLLTCLAGMSATDIEQGGAIPGKPYGPSSVAIGGVDVVTVGIPYGFQCSAWCSPPCTFSWTRNNVTSQGRELNLLLRQIEPTQVMICTAVNRASGASTSVQKTLQVTAGPSNIQISGPGFLTIGTPSAFTCSADCYPSCSYTWTVKWDKEVLETAAGNTISILPPPTVISETLICQAQSTVSHLYIATNVLLPVASLSDIYITGPDTVTMGQQGTFLCFATCTPSCDFTWRFRNNTYTGDEVLLPILQQGDKPQYASELVITVDDNSKTFPLVCQVRNDASQAVISATKELTLIDPVSVRPASEALPVTGDPFSLQCVGAQNPASVGWQKNGRSLPTSERVRLSPDGITLTFSPLLQADGGSYQCVVSEGGGPIQSEGYDLRVIYGPNAVTIVNPNKGPLGREMFALPGSKTELQCSTDCFPACSFTWFYHGTLLSNNASVLFTPTTPPNQAALTCVAFNSVTKQRSTVWMEVVVTDGPEDVTISGPESLEVGVTASFRCSAECVPSCRFTWSVYGEPMVGGEIEITLSRYVPAESISCQAENTVSGKMATVNETLQVSEPLWCGC